MESCGMVWLVGAGPGDAGLLTVKGKQLLKTADVIIYDALVQLELLTEIPEQIEKIYVGKRAGNHSASQEEINEMILREALKGKRVVRLKGGDPFVFGRGAEELELLTRHGISFEIVPGITSAVSVLAYAGIPVTHRDFTSSFHIITGHTSKGKKKPVNYHALAQLDATLIFLMGISSMEEICHNLVKEGMNPNTPAAVIERGTTARQKKVISTLQHLKRDCDNVNIKTPAIIAVGRVCELAKDFEWAETRPLGNTQVVITRQKKKSSVLAEKLLQKGAHVIEFPSIEIVPIKDKTAFQMAIKELMQRNRQDVKNAKKRESMMEDMKTNWIVLTSPTGVERFFSLLKEEKIDLRMFLSTEKKFAVSGSATAAELEQHGIYADLMPKRFSGKDLGYLLGESVEKGDKIYLFRSALADEELPEILANAGLAYKEIPIYNTIYHVDPEWKEPIWDMIEKNEIDYVAFTSASTVRGFTEAMGKRDFSIVPALCIGEKTAIQARIYGMKTTVSKKATMDGMVEAILEKNKQ